MEREILRCKRMKYVVVVPVAVAVAVAAAVAVAMVDLMLFYLKTSMHCRATLGLRPRLLVTCDSCRPAIPKKKKTAMTMPVSVSVLWI